MTNHPPKTFAKLPMNGAARFLFENSLFLIGGAALALVWANFEPASYHLFVHYPLLPGPADEGHSLLHVVNDGLMALFFAMAAKEVWESLLPGGALSRWSTAATPLMATLGGVLAPAVIYLVGASVSGHLADLGRGWAIPCATDIAFSYLIARLVFGTGHPAIAFLLLLAIADDAIGLLILAIFYPQGTLHLSWMLLSVAAVAVSLAFRRFGVRSFWWYLLGPGLMSWLAFHLAGIHAALGLVPIIPTLPHATSDAGLYANEESHHTDTLSAFANWWKNPVELILGMFGLVNAGVIISNFALPTWLVLAGLVIGKPLGITGFTFLGERVMGLKRPEGMSYRHVVTMGIVAGIGFTVALFVSTAAFPVPGAVQDSAKMGALASFFAALIAVPVGRLLGIRPKRLNDAGKDSSNPDAQREPQPASTRSPCVQNV